MGEDIGIVFDCFLFLSFPLLLSSDSYNMKHSVLFPLLYVQYFLKWSVTTQVMHVLITVDN